MAEQQKTQPEKAEEQKTQPEKAEEQKTVTLRLTGPASYGPVSGRQVERGETVQVSEAEAEYLLTQGFVRS